MKETIAYLNNLLKDNDTIVIGLSGGPDSMCLLDILLSLNKNLKIICAHINHGIRKESIEEKQFIEEYCSKRQIKLETTTFEKKSPTEDFNELELREKRYQYFGKLMHEYKAEYLLTAHHGDDLVETILMRISRGSNLKGYSGFQIESIKNGYKVIKPLIFMTKENIEKYNKEHKIPYVIDRTNLEDKYTRNRYRHNILPFLKNENNNIHLKYLKFSHELIKYYIFIDKVITKEISSRYSKKNLDLSGFEHLDPLIQTKIIEYILDDNYPDNLYLVNDKHVMIILNIIKNPKPNIEIDLPNNIRIIKSYTNLKITSNKKTDSSYTLKIEDNCLLPNGRQITKINDTDKNTNDYIKLNSEEISLPLYVRTRKNGDKMIIKNMSSYKKLKDIFIDSKLSKEKRDEQPVVTDSKGKILWLPGLKKSKFDKAKDEIYDIILWYN